MSILPAVDGRTPPAVFLPNPVKPGRFYKSVPYIKEALSRAGLYPWAPKLFTRFAGPVFVHAVKKFQKAHDIDPSGVYGLRTHDALRAAHRKGYPHEWAFGPSQIAGLLALKPKPNVAVERVDDYYRWWDWFEANRDPIHYSQARPIPGMIDHQRPPRLPLYADCSGTVLYCAWLAGVDPSKLQPSNVGFGYGYTGTLCQGGFSITTNEVPLYNRDHIILGFYGYSWDSTEHVVSVKSLDPVVIYSDGSEAAPDMWTSLYELPFLGLKAYRVT